MPEIPLNTPKQGRLVAAYERWYELKTQLNVIKNAEAAAREDLGLLIHDGVTNPDEPRYEYITSPDGNEVRVKAARSYREIWDMAEVTDLLSEYPALLDAGCVTMEPKVRKSQFSSLEKFVGPTYVDVLEDLGHCCTIKPSTFTIEVKDES